MSTGQGVRMTTDLDDPDAVPYFLWDDPMTLSELRRRLREAPEPERILLLARILREAWTRRPGDSPRLRKWSGSGPG